MLCVFFRGTDSFLFAPGILTLLIFAVLALYSNFQGGWALPKTATVVFCCAVLVVAVFKPFLVQRSLYQHIVHHYSQYPACAVPGACSGAEFGELGKDARRVYRVGNCRVRGLGVGSVFSAL